MSEAENPPFINAKTTGDKTHISKKAPSLFVKIQLPASKFEKKTKIIKESYDPVWDESFTM
ncbi:hypothetical protein B0H21DRAFT_827942 [Amylocystis lapponica]|nr:hypothetical protein B0H21DRAFT_827942 [Amylocystis lapponica]